MRIRTSALNVLSGLAAGGTLLLGVTFWTSSSSQAVEKPETPLKVARLLDSLTQSRFQDDMTNFGMSRMLPAAGGHLAFGHMLLPTDQDLTRFRLAESAHRDFAIGFFHCAHISGKAAKSPVFTEGTERPAGRPSLPTAQTAARPAAPSPVLLDPAENVSHICDRLAHLYSVSGKGAYTEATKLYRQMGEAAQTALPQLKKGEGVEHDIRGWLIVLRPVRAMKASCLKCHAGAKQGDTLGVMAYIVSKQTFLPTPTAIKPASASSHRF